jgi:RNA 2',3'-cyclic 3'-phosphodiesterase
MKRIFIAIRIEPGEKLAGMISSFKMALKNDSIKWTEISNIHITLVFLGDTEEKRVREIDTILAEICHGFGDFDLVLRGAGVFKNLKDPRVLWTGIDHSEQMINLNRHISARLRDTGTKLEDRPFSPHLTLGRIKKITDPVKMKALIDEFNGKEIQRVHVSGIILYESILRPEGPVYRAIGKYCLQ